MLCEHLQPVLAYLLARGAGIETHQLRDSCWETITLNDFFYKREIETWFVLPACVAWAYADPHFGEGNSLNCSACQCSLVSRFDASHPDRTLGMGK